MFSLTEWIGRWGLRTFLGEGTERVDYSDRAMAHFDKWQPTYRPQSTLYLQHSVDAHVPQAIREMRSEAREAELEAQRKERMAEALRVDMIGMLYNEEGSMRVDYLNEAGLNAWFKAVREYLHGNGCVPPHIIKAIDGFINENVEVKRAMLSIVVALIDSANENSYEDWKDDLSFE